MEIPRANDGPSPTSSFDLHANGLSTSPSSVLPLPPSTLHGLLSKSFSCDAELQFPDADAASLTANVPVWYDAAVAVLKSSLFVGRCAMTHCSHTNEAKAAMTSFCAKQLTNIPNLPKHTFTTGIIATALVKSDMQFVLAPSMSVAGVGEIGFSTIVEVTKSGPATDLQPNNAVIACLEETSTVSDSKPDWYDAVALVLKSAIFVGRCALTHNAHVNHVSAAVNSFVRKQLMMIPNLPDYVMNQVPFYMDEVTTIVMDKMTVVLQPSLEIAGVGQISYNATVAVSKFGPADTVMEGGLVCAIVR